ncbi:hypothetical protein IMZ48_13645 [Candidatus Bathyarchaeota archaeon]|nr:hypothetical protein [Candidatus Bathyarchaeota archaeon]
MFNAYKQNATRLEVESKKALDDYEAETASLGKTWFSTPNFSAAHVAIQLQKREAELKRMEGEAADRNIRNLAGFEQDLGSILKEIVAKDTGILEVSVEAPYVGTGVSGMLVAKGWW